jgi:PAS domain S-box-containing protein
MKVTVNYNSITLLLLGLFLNNICNAQAASGNANKFYVEHFGQDEGLPQNSVNNILPDKNGFLWIATEGGITRFNGNRFLSVAGTGNISGTGFTRVKSFYYKGNDTIIAYSSANNQVAIIVNNKIVAVDEFLYRKHGLLFTNLHSSVPTPDYYLTHSGMNNFGAAEGWYRDDGAIHGTVYDKDTLLVLEDTGIGIYNAKGKAGELKLDLPDIGAIIFVHDQAIYLDKENYINFYSVRGSRKRELLDIPAKNKPTLFSNSFGNSFFCVADSDLYRVDIKSGKINVFKLLTNLQYPADITTIYQKDSNTIITGTLRNGLYVYKKQLFKTSDPLPYGEVDAFYGQVLLPDNETILAGKDYLFRAGRYVGKKGLGFELDSYASIKDSKGYYWYSYNGYIVRARKIGAAPDTMVYPQGLFERLLFEDRQGNVWVHSDEKLGYVSNGRFAELQINNLDPNKINCMRQDIEGRYWIGTKNGLFVLKGLHEQEMQAVPAFKSHDIRFIWPEANGQIWICTYGQGFYLITKDGVVPFPENNGRLAYVHCIIEDAKGYFWMPSNNGLFVTAKESLIDYAENRDKIPFYYEFSKKQGFRTNEFNGGCEPPFLQLPNGKISLASMHGLVSFDPAAINLYFSSSPILIDNIELDSTEPIKYNGFDIASKIRNIRFSISSSFWGEKENDLLEYRVLENGKSLANGSWLPVTGTGEINLFTPSDGNYRLIIRKRKGLKADDYAYKEVSFRVLPKWYRTNAFLVAELVGVILFMQGLFIFRRRYYRRINRVLKEKVNAATVELQLMNDTLERKVVERTEAIRQAEIKFRTLSESALVGVYSIAGGKLTYVNPTFAKIFGYEPSELIGADPIAIIHPDNPPEALENARKRLAGELEEMRYELDGLCKNGEKRKIEVYGSTMVLNDEAILLGNVIDITPLKESELKFKNLVEKSLVGVYIIQAGKYVYVNPKLAEILGYSEGELLNLDNVRIIVDESYRPRELEEWRRKVDVGIIDDYHSELKYYRKDGKAIWAEVNCGETFYKGAKAILGTFQDITERKEVEVRILERESRLTAFFESIDGAASLMDAEKKYVLFNKRFIDIHRRLSGQDPRVGEGAYDLFPEEIRRERLKMLDNVLNGNKETTDVDYIINGQRVCLFTSYIPVITGGKVTGVCTYSVDLTKSKEAERRIRERESQLTAFFENIDGAASLLDAEKRYVLFNRRFIYDHRLLTGRDPRAGEVVYDGFPEDIRRERLKLLDNVINGTKEAVDVDYLRNGKRICYFTSFNPVITDGKVTGISTYSIDLTKSKEAEIKVRESEEKFRLSFMTSQDAFYIGTLDEGKIIDVNQSFFDLFGYSREESIGKTSTELKLYVYPEDRERMVTGLKANGNLKDLELTCRKKSGELIIVSITVNVWRMNNEQVIMAVIRDVTERKRSEEALFKANQRLELASVVAGTAVWEIDFNTGSMISENKVWDDLYGLDNEDAANQFNNGIHEDDREKVWKNVKDHFEGKTEKYFHEFRFKNPKTAIEKWISDVGKVIEYNKDGSPSKILGISVDITERKKVETELAQSEERNRALIENISDAITLLDENLKPIYRSPSVMKILGFSKEEMSDKTLFDSVHPDDLPKGRAFFQKVYNSPGIPMQAQFRLLHKYGHYIWVDGTLINMLHNKSINAVIVTYRDITERKNFEEQQLLIASIVNSSDDAIISKNLNGIITSWNKGAQKLLGYAFEEVIGRHISIVIPDELKDEEEAILQRIREGRSIDHYETRRVRKDGVIIDALLTISPITDSLGIVVGASKILRDVTERNLYEQKLAKAAIQAQEEERYEIGGELHDNVCQVLVSALIYLKMMKDSLAPDLMEYFDQTSLYITNATEEIRNLSHRLAPALFDETTLEDAFKDLLIKFNIEGKFQILLRFDRFAKKRALPRELQLNLYRILQEQLRNILKHAKATKLEVFMSIYNDVLIFRIIDNGVGLNSEESKKGIGLANMKRRAGLFSGSFAIFSPAGGGCEVRVEVPLPRSSPVKRIATRG